MLTEWRSNIWLVLELVIVGACLFYITFQVYNIARIYMIPEGYDGHGNVVVKSTYKEPGSQGYTPYDSVPGDENPVLSGRLAEKLELIHRLERNPLVAGVGYGPNSIPYNMSYSGTILYKIAGTDTLEASTNVRTMTPSYIDVLRIAPYGKTTREELKAALARGEVLVSENVVRQLNDAASKCGIPALYDSPYDLVGKTLWGYGFKDEYKIGGIINNQKRNQYEEPGAVIIMPVPDPITQEWHYYNLSVSLKPGVTPFQFIEDITNRLKSEYTVGNLSVSSLVRMDKTIAEQGRSQRQEVLFSTGCILFLSMSIFLGLLGTFWFRTNLRIKEIAIRLVNGATWQNLLRRMLSEGFILLLCAAPFIFYIEHLIYKYNLGGRYMGPDQPFSYVVWTNVITFAILSLMIFLGVVIPASKAVRVSPAESLKEF